MANDRFYGYKQKKDELTLPNGNINNTLERVNPYEFKKGMDYELTKAGFPSLRESPENEREKATTKVLNALNKDPYHYSCKISYETETRGLEKKPTFAAYKKQFKEMQMQEVKVEKLKEAIDKKVKNILGKKKILKENRTLPNKSEIIKGYEDANQGSVDEKYINDIIDKFANTANAPSPKPRIRQQNNPTDAEIDAKTQRGIDGRAAERNRPRPRPVPNPIDENQTSSLERVAQQVWGEQDLNKAKEILIQYVEKSKINDHSKRTIIQKAGVITNKRKLDFYVANSLLHYEKLGVKEGNDSNFSDFNDEFKLSKILNKLVFSKVKNGPALLFKGDELLGHVEDRDDINPITYDLDYIEEDGTGDGGDRRTINLYDTLRLWTSGKFKLIPADEYLKNNTKENKMTKNDLKEMIATELADFFKEEDDIDVSVDDGGEGGEEEESISLLHQIYDMLKDKFEGGEEDPVEEDPVEEDPVEEDPVEEGIHDEEAADVVALQERFSKLANLDRLNG